jgi:hypothetical protein
VYLLPSLFTMANMFCGYACIVFAMRGEFATAAPFIGIGIVLDKVVVGYGAPGKGNTLLNYCGIRTDLLAYTVDRSPAKHGHFLPGTHIPVHLPDEIMRTRPDYVLILPWNLKEEIMQQMAAIGDWGGRFVVPIPEVAVYDAPSAAVADEPGDPMEAEPMKRATR